MSTNTPEHDAYGRPSGPQWPVTMPGAAPQDRLGADHGNPRYQAAQLLDDAGHDLAQLQQLITTPGLPVGAVKAASAALDAIGAVRGQVHYAAGRLDHVAADDLIPEKGRQRLLRETREQAADALRELEARSDVAITALEGHLLQQAQPTFPAAADREEAREELRLLLDASDDPAATLRQLATGTDPRLAALAVSSYARTYLRAKGVDEETIKATATYAAQAALASGDPARVAAARALTKLPQLRKARAQALTAAAFALS